MVKADTANPILNTRIVEVKGLSTSPNGPGELDFDVARASLEGPTAADNF